ncbi:HlyD family secretion protein [Teichococcus aerophilus]|nr:HlyD family secretion protein [Pseudoroseomonas aerophila]
MDREVASEAGKAAAPVVIPANPLRRVALFVVLAVVLLFGMSIVMERLTPSSSQAVVQAYVVQMAPDVSGRVIEVNVTDNARVETGAVLFRIDARPFEIAVTEAQAQVERIGQTIGASTAAVDSAQAKLVKATADFDNIQAQAQRTFELVQRGVLSKAKGDEARAALEGSRAAVSGAGADLARAREELGPRGADNPQLKGALAALERARLNLLHTSVIAPAPGVVTNLRLATGQYIGAGQAALTFIDASSIWVSANFKENSLEYMATLDNAEVVFDSLPGSVFPARVESIGWGVSQGGIDPSTGLPSIRSDSGWVREPQRFPVRLVFENGPPRGIRFGSQVNVVVYTDRNPVANALGAFWIRLISILTYAS